MITSTPSLLTREQFSLFRTVYLKLANLRQLESEDMLIYNIIRQLPKDRGFTPITNPVKLAAGADPHLSLKQ